MIARHRLALLAVAVLLPPALRAAETQGADGPPLTELRLPWIEEAVPHDDDRPRIVVECLADQAIRVLGNDAVEMKVLDGPGRFAELSEALEAETRGWETESVPRASVGIPIDVGRGSIVVRTHGVLPFASVQHLLAVGASLETPVRNFELACRDAATLDDDTERALSATDTLEVCVPHALPVDAPLEIAEGEVAPQEDVTLVIRVREKGSRIDPRTGGPAADGEAWAYGDDRTLEYSLGPFRMTDLASVEDRLRKLRGPRADERASSLRLVLDPRRGVTYGEALAAHQALMSSGLGKGVEIAGSYE
ncbi:MAG: hypothetical protein AAFR54_09750 [Planctomycetota bacterium]